MKRWCALGLLLACQREKAPEPALGAPVELQGVQARQVTGQTVTLEATAKRVSLWPGERELLAKEAWLVLPKDGVSLVADSLTAHLGEGRVVGRAVQFETDGGLRGSTPEAEYVRPLGLVTGHSGLSAVRDGLTIDAGAFELDLKTRRAVFEQPVTELTNLRRSKRLNK